METLFEQEIRFALVMYGGVSLAIYMNGITQEFLHLVRSTAANALSGTEGVYRELAGIVKSRFVVDIASGTSAGGINAIFLGKALSNGQGLDELARLWLDEADLSDLWNDSANPGSLLSSSGMYDKLARALQGMDDGGASGALLSEMDVFITCTDIQGLELPIQLSDMTVAEKRHKNVVHLRFAEGRDNDFRREMNPLLAFAARATSSFPFAFEPMRYIDAGGANVPNAERFFPDYATDADYIRRAFGDGGYLNNKPFSHAINELPRRITQLRSQRKLVYIEPSPEQASGVAAERRPGALRNSWEAAVTLHQYETIREDLQQVLDRNRLIERVREVIDLVEEDVRKWQASGQNPAARLSGPDYARRTMVDEIHERGPGYAGYHRLKVRAVTDDLADIVRCAGNLRETAEESKAVRTIIGKWRASTYSEDDAQSSESLFLLHFDLGYRQRRVRFLLTKLDEHPDSAELRLQVNQVARDLEDLQRRGREAGSANFAYDTVGRGEVDAVAAVLRREFSNVTEKAAADLETCLEGHPLKRYFDYYEYYDQVTFPIFYETEVGEAEHVDVFRISPQDARTLIDEQSATEHRRKLAGTALFHFGAFLKRDWRSNDILWGRLDGAERIITSVLPRGSEQAAGLIRKAHLAIVRETFAGDETMYERLRTDYEVNRKLGRWAAIKLMAHASLIGAKMLKGLLIQ